MKTSHNYANMSLEFTQWLLSKDNSTNVTDIIAALNAVNYYVDEKLSYGKSLAEIEDYNEIRDLRGALNARIGFKVMNKYKNNICMKSLKLYEDFIKDKYGYMEESEFSPQNRIYTFDPLIVELFKEAKYDNFLKALDKNALYKIRDLKGLNLLYFFNRNEILDGPNRFLLMADVAKKLKTVMHKSEEKCDELLSTANTKEIHKESKSSVEDILASHFKNGFRIDSPIELKRYRRFALENYGMKIVAKDDSLREEILKAGILLDGKVYAVSEKTKENIKRVAQSAFDRGNGIVFYKAFFDKHESWLFNEGVLSAEMLSVVLKSVCSDYLHKRSYFTMDTSITINSELIKCFEHNTLLNYDQLIEILQYIPMDKIRLTLSQDEDFIWNTVGVYTHISKFKITEEEKHAINAYAEEQVNRNGYISLADLSIENIAERNNEFSVTALHNSIFHVCLDGEYERHGKIVTRKGVELDALEITKRYCRSLERCTLEDLLTFEKDLTGEIHHWISMGAAYSEMVRIDATTFVAQKLVEFDVDIIDAVLDDFCPGDYIPLRSVTTFVAFPHVRQPWTHFLLESYVRRFSHNYRFEVLSVNSKNCGAIVRENCKLSYREIMADAVAKSNIVLKQKVVLEFLYTNGYIGRRSVSGISSLISQAKLYREGEL